MCKMLYPTQEAASSYVIDYDKLYKMGIRGLIYDIDNTLVMHGAPANGEALKLFARLKSIGFDTCLISNNKEPRVKPFADAVGSKYIYKADKPSRKNYIKAMEMMGTDAESTYFIGDQLFTDICGANRAGIRSILVKPIDPKEEIQIILKRILEKPVLFIYHHRRKR